jgi:hypothetical protein
MRFRSVATLVLLAAALAAGYLLRPAVDARLGRAPLPPAAEPAAHAPKYQCSMHPQIVSDHPGPARSARCH